MADGPVRGTDGRLTRRLRTITSRQGNQPMDGAHATNIWPAHHGDRDRRDRVAGSHELIIGGGGAGGGGDSGSHYRPGPSPDGSGSSSHRRCGDGRAHKRHGYRGGPVGDLAAAGARAVRPAGLVLRRCCAQRLPAMRPHATLPPKIVYERRTAATLRRSGVPALRGNVYLGGSGCTDLRWAAASAERSPSAQGSIAAVLRRR